MQIAPITPGLEQGPKLAAGTVTNTLGKATATKQGKESSSQLTFEQQLFQSGDAPLASAGATADLGPPPGAAKSEVDDPVGSSKQVEGGLEAQLQPLLVGGGLDAVKLAAGGKSQSRTLTHPAEGAQTVSAKDTAGKSTAKIAGDSVDAAAIPSSTSNPVSAAAGSNMVPQPAVLADVPASIPKVSSGERYAVSGKTGAGQPAVSAKPGNVTSPPQGPGADVGAVPAMTLDTPEAAPLPTPPLSFVPATPTHASQDAASPPHLQAGVVVPVSPLASEPSPTVSTINSNATTISSEAAFSSSLGARNDAAGVGDGHVMLTSTANVLEVGLSNGTHGWVRVRAEISDNGVSASVSTSSAVAFDALHKELPALSEYLAHEVSGVTSLVVGRAHPESAMGDATTAASTGGGASQGGRRESDSFSWNATNIHVDEQAQATAGNQGSLVNMLPGNAISMTVASYASGSGSWLSVMA